MVFYIIIFNAYDVAIEIFVSPLSDEEVGIQGCKVTHLLTGGSVNSRSDLNTKAFVLSTMHFAQTLCNYYLFIYLFIYLFTDHQLCVRLGENIGSIIKFQTVP